MKNANLCRLVLIALGALSAPRAVLAVPLESDTLQLRRNTPITETIVGCVVMPDTSTPGTPTPCVATVSEDPANLNEMTGAVTLDAGVARPTFALGTTSVSLTEPDGTVSDLVTLTITNFNHALIDFAFTFISDPHSGLETAPGGSIPETGQNQNITAALFSVPASPGGVVSPPFQVLFQSDQDIDMPEPASVLLFGIGVLGAGWARRKGRRV